MNSYKSAASNNMTSKMPDVKPKLSSPSKPHTSKNPTSEQKGVKTKLMTASKSTVVKPGIVSTSKSNASEDSKFDLPGSRLVRRRKDLKAKMNLALLPDIPLRLIASFLPFEEGMSLSQMLPHWVHLQPTVQHVKGRDFDIAGPKWGHIGRPNAEGRRLKMFTL